MRVRVCVRVRVCACVCVSENTGLVLCFTLTLLMTFFCAWILHLWLGFMMPQHGHAGEECEVVQPLDMDGADTY